MEADATALRVFRLLGRLEWIAFGLAKKIIGRADQLISLGSPTES